MSARYLTTTIPYVNADPHIGFALEIVQADVLARAMRLAGDEVFFSTGADEHGQKIYDTAKKANQEPQEYVDHYAAEFQKMKDALDISTDAFIRTTNPAHIQAAQEMWRRCEAKGDIYKKSYEGLYCVGCESFKTEKELVDGKCPLHPNLALEKISEENYFFRFSNYQRKLLEYLERPGTLIPEWRRLEALNFVKDGLEDFSISREKSRLSWGIPVPCDDSQVMYVWFDALTNYISTLGWPEDAEGNFKKFWEEGVTLQVAGKDQVRFQSLMWQAMLLSADIKTTDIVFYHGFITSGGQKMSKSLGNVISPFDLVKKYGTDATRYMLLRHVHSTEDSDVTWERLDEWYTADLVNGLGNLVARTMQMASQYFDNPVDLSDRRKPMSVQQRIEKFEFNNAMTAIWSDISVLDGLIQEQKPFEVFKTEKERARLQVIYLVKELSRIAELLQPFMPKTSEKIQLAIKENKKPENLFPRI
ncbi:methionine--tRNA ligase [Candidatus Kaiserbacteria bacterium RIFOXYD1_FULL_47_14]|uniref:Methionine--tRNA ligase n=1 Tax=Candidatus Kaiserbacteria bacterium RIFOXYD1_FULL_47_14 TaxID=1798533 RepID=A0A1F6G3Q1_9BACT|nr:MAG: methionine--tRNA ligase [Candidatus Kaiserbacteria bacterium RIFOXYD1_FULL_47_14]